MSEPTTASSSEPPPYLDLSQNLFGTVTLIDWMRVPWVNRLIYGVRGSIKMMGSQAAFGFTTQGGGHADWVLIVSGPTQTLIVPGCKVQLVTLGTSDGNDEFTSIP